ncbi:hypothetical protein Tco_0376370 [Tanacetum coccineum]
MLLKGSLIAIFTSDLILHSQEFLPDIAPGISAYRSWSPTIVCLISLGADKRIEVPAISPITVKKLVILQQTV